VLVPVTALAGIAVNLAATWAISNASRTSLNVEGAYQHILTDLFGFIATAIVGAVVIATGFAQAGAIASLVVVILMVWAGADLVRQSGRIFMEAAPAGTDPDAIGDRLAAADAVAVAVAEVHDLHVWTITSGSRPCPPTSLSPRAATATACAAPCSGCSARSTRSPTPPCRSTTSARTRSPA
jgi:cobalt-zinc-cadmium efflux system protein